MVCSSTRGGPCGQAMIQGQIISAFVTCPNQNSLNFDHDYDWKVFEACAAVLQRTKMAERRLDVTEELPTRIAEEGEVKASRRQGSSSLMMRKLPPGAVWPSSGFKADLRARLRPAPWVGGFERSALHMPAGVCIMTVSTCVRTQTVSALSMCQCCRDDAG